MSQENYDNLSLFDLKFKLQTMNADEKPNEYSELKSFIDKRVSDALEAANSEYEKNKYRTISARIIAAIVDAICMFGVFYGIHNLLSGEQFLQGPVVGYLFLLLPFIYSVLFHALFGKTIGKMVTGIRVVTKEEEIIGLKHSLLCDMVPIMMIVISLIPGLAQVAFFAAIIGYLQFEWFFIEVLSTLTNKKRRAVHDYIAGTVVIHDPLS